LGSVFGSSHNCGEKRIGDVGNDHAQGMGFLLCQTARQQIWTVVELANCSFNSSSESCTYSPGIVDDRRHGEYGNLGLARDVVNTRRFGESRPSGSSGGLAHKKSAFTRLRQEEISSVRVFNLNSAFYHTTSRHSERWQPNNRVLLHIDSRRVRGC